MENTKAVVPWKNALAQAESKMQLLIADPLVVKRELGFALQAMEGSDALQKCDPHSIMNAVLNIARTGLTLNPVLKLGYLIPRKNKAIFDISYMGMCKVLVDAGGFKTIEAYVIYKDEVDAGRFIYEPVTGNVRYDPIYPETEAEQNNRKEHGVLTIAVLSDGSRNVMFTPKWKIMKAERISEGSGSSWSPWKNFRDEMFRKTAIRSHFKTLPKGKITAQLEAVMNLEEENNPVDYSKGNTERNIAEDIFTDIEPETKYETAVDAALAAHQIVKAEIVEAEEPEVKPEIQQPKEPTFTPKLKKNIEAIENWDAFAAYVNNLTHFHKNSEFLLTVRAKAASFQNPGTTKISFEY